MEEVEERVKALTMTEILTELRKFGEVLNVPNAPAAKPILERKLVKHICGQTDEGRFERHNVWGVNAIDPLSDQNQESVDISPESSGGGTNSPPVDERSGSGHLNKSPLSLVSDDNPGIMRDNSDITFYGVRFPEGYEFDDQTDGVKVFTDKSDALNIVKKVKGSRFKSFRSRDEAASFSEQSPTMFKSQSSEKDFTTSPKTAVGESLPFPSLRTQDLVQLRRTVEQNKCERFKDLVWGNPRYLVSSGDTPTILQEGFRYNAMHSAALKNRSDMAQLLLDTLEDPAFLGKLYINDDVITRDKRIAFLVDLYLNTPDKGFNETPLHFACKFGHLAVVKVLTSHPKVNRLAVNSEGKTPAQIVCSRLSKPSEDLRKDILSELEEKFYVPLWRSDDNTVIGEPWSPTEGSDWPTSPTITSPLSPRINESVMRVRALAGPMSPNKAIEFHRNWSTPPRGCSLADKKSFHEIRRQDNDKGFERIGRDLAHNLNTPWLEYWPFLDCCVDITSVAGMDKLDRYLEKKSLEISDSAGCQIRNTTPENICVAGDHSLKTPNSLDRKLDDVIDKFSSLQIHSPGGDSANESCASFEGNSYKEKSTLQVKCPADKTTMSQPKQGTHLSLEYIIPALSPALKLMRNVLRNFWWRRDDTETHFAQRTESLPQTMSENKDETDATCRTPEKLSSAKLLPVYINGAVPTKSDLDVLRALGSVDIPEQLVNVIRWKQLVTKSSDEERRGWRTPCRPVPRDTKVLRRSKLTLTSSQDVQTNLMDQFSSMEAS